MFRIETYNAKRENILIDFLKLCLPESNRILDLDDRHRFYRDIEKYFVAFWCMLDNEKIIGTVAVKELDKKKCELKSLYLLESYHGKGLGRCLVKKFIQTEQYNQNKFADIFMVLNLKS